MNHTKDNPQVLRLSEYFQVDGQSKTHDVLHKIARVNIELKGAYFVMLSGVPTKVVSD